MERMNDKNINHMWMFVKEKYPDARFDYWFEETGELIFYPTGRAEDKLSPTYCCVIRYGQYTILTEF